MKFVPRQPAEGINVSKTHPLSEAATLFVGFAALFLVVTVLLVYLVEILLGLVSAETETRLFRNWTPADQATAQEMPLETRHANELLRRLAGHWPDSRYKFRLMVDQSGVPNAMALPGGLIVVTRGLLERVGSENELAFVLGHELGHFSNRDHIRQLGRITMLSMFFAAITQGRAGGRFGYGVSDLALRGFNREQERRADEFGLSLVQAEYGHVNDAWRFFERLAADRASDGILFAYYDTHPQPNDRIEALRDHARGQGWPLKGPLQPWPMGQR